MLPFILSGCSGGGKSALLKRMEVRGFPVIEEAGRRIVKAEIARDSDGLPWKNPQKFALLAAELVEQDLRMQIHSEDISFIDRSIVDLYAYLCQLKLSTPEKLTNLLKQMRFQRRVFMVPPWLEIYEEDDERRKSYTEAVNEFQFLIKTYEQFGYELIFVPKLTVDERTDFVLDHVFIRS